MITYYAKARNAAGKIEQILVTMDPGKRKTQWTGKIYKSDREADADITALNSKTGDERCASEMLG